MKSAPLPWALLLVLCAQTLAGQRPAPASFGQAPLVRIIQIDVGQGDAAVVITPEGRTVLIDAGRSGDDIARVLAKEGIETLDLVIATHPHADHIGGMPAVFALTSVRSYIDSGIPHTTRIYREVLGAVEGEPGLQYIAATPRTLTLGSVKV